MVLHKHGERLYTGLKEVVTHHLETKVWFDWLQYKYILAHITESLTWMFLNLGPRRCSKVTPQQFPTHFESSMEWPSNLNGHDKGHSYVYGQSLRSAKWSWQCLQLGVNHIQGSGKLK
jgi:hypothetical protein